MSALLDPVVSSGPPIAWNQERTAAWRHWAARFGTPFYVYDLDEAAARLSELQEALSSSSKIFYSAKANPLLAPVFANWGCGVEVTSRRELQMALLKDGRNNNNILFGGPAQTEEEMAEALASGVRYFSMESCLQCLMLDRIARSQGARPSVILRVNPTRCTGARLSMTGVPSQFGMDMQSVQQDIEIIRKCSNVQVAGVHVYLGTQLHVDALPDACRIALEAFDTVSHLWGQPLKVLNFGGGFPWPYGNTGRTSLTLLPQALRSQFNDARKRGLECWFEAGRYLAASSGTLVCQVLEDKRSHDRRFVLVDAGLHCLGGMSGLRRSLRQQVDVLSLLSENALAATSRATVVGPLCTPQDIVAQDVPLPQLDRGHLLSIPNVGAYGLTASLVAFLGKPPLAELFVRGGNLERAFMFTSLYKELNDA